MKLSLLAPLLLFCWSAAAQFSVIEYDTTNRFRLFGQEWSPSLFSLASTETDKMNDEGGRISTYNYLTMATYFAQDWRFALRVPFQYNTAGTDRFNGAKQNGSEIFLQDLILGVQNYNFAFLPWDLGTYWEGRVYLPTGKFSQSMGMIARLRNEFIISKIFNRYVGVEYDQKFNYYLQSRTVYPVHFEDEDGFPVDALAATKRTELDHWVVVWGNLMPEISVGWKLGAEDTTWNRSAAENKSKPAEHLIKTGPSVRFPVGRLANFIFAYEDKVDADNNRAEFGRFLAKNTSFTLISFLRF